VNAYTYEGLVDGQLRKGGWVEGKENISLNYDFYFEFARGKLLSFRDKSYAKKLIKNPDANDVVCWLEGERIPMKEFWQRNV